jgi:trimeric autotransporter adhesin
VTNNNRLIRFNVNLPAIIQQNIAITGIVQAQKIVGLDFRPATGELYAMSYDEATGAARLYTLNPTTGVAMPIGTTDITLKSGISRLSMDFNPTVDRVRVVGSDGSNYRLHPMTGVLVATDVNLTYASNSSYASRTPAIGAIGYTNSFAGSTATTLYDYDEVLNLLSTQIPPNNGVLNPVGTSGIVANSTFRNTDMDIYFDPATSGNWAYLSINNHVNDPNFTRLCRIDLNTGKANTINVIGFRLQVRDIAVQPKPRMNRPAPNTTESIVYSAVTDSDLRIFPNPASETTTISFRLNNAANIQADVLDMFGRVVGTVANQQYEAGSVTIPLETSKYTSGTYLVRILTDGQLMKVEKLVIKA